MVTASTVLPARGSAAAAQLGGGRQRVVVGVGVDVDVQDRHGGAGLRVTGVG